MAATRGTIRGEATFFKPPEGTLFVRIRFALALMVAGLLVAAGVASAQTTTDPTSGYTVTTTATGSYTTTTPTTTTTETQTQTQSTGPAVQGATQGTTQSGSTAPAVSAATQQAPSQLAFTGAEPLLLIVLGLAGAGVAATLLVRDRRRATQRR